MGPAVSSKLPQIAKRMCCRLGVIYRQCVLHAPAPAPAMPGRTLARHCLFTCSHFGPWHPPTMLACVSLRLAWYPTATQAARVSTLPDTHGVNRQTGEEHGGEACRSPVNKLHRKTGGDQHCCTLAAQVLVCTLTCKRHW